MFHLYFKDNSKKILDIYTQLAIFKKLIINSSVKYFDKTFYRKNAVETISKFVYYFYSL